MSPETEALARRAVACKGWRWMPGMLARPTRLRVTEQTGPVGSGWFPDLTDPATLGCLLALVRERTAPGVTTFCIGSEWTVGQNNALAFDLAADWHATEAAALVDALEAAP